MPEEKQLIQPLSVERDEYGFWTHPAWQLDFPFSGAHAEHDDARGVTCWVSDDSRAGLSCLPDWMLRWPELVGNERQSSPHEQESEPTPAKAPGRWDEERYSL